MNTTVMAINPATVKAHQNYTAKRGYGFPILSDPGSETVADYKCLKATGKGVLRTVYAIDPRGTVIFAERGNADLDDVKNRIESMT